MIVLDTHILVCWANDEARLSTNARTAIAYEQSHKNGLILVSAMSAWEIALLVERKRLNLGMSLDDWFRTVNEIEGVRFEPLSVPIAIESNRLPGNLHKDPADRIIVALARHHNVPLVTADQKIREYKYVRSIW